MHACRSCRIVLIVIRWLFIGHLSSTPKTPFAHRLNNPLPRLWTGNPTGSLFISSATAPVVGETNSLPDDNDRMRIGDFRIPSQYFNPREIIQPNSHSELTILHKYLQCRSFILRCAVRKMSFLFVKYLYRIIRWIGGIDEIRFD